MPPCHLYINFSQYLKMAVRCGPTANSQQLGNHGTNAFKMDRPATKRGLRAVGRKGHPVLRVGRQLLHRIYARRQQAPRLPQAKGDGGPPAEGMFCPHPPRIFGQPFSRKKIPPRRRRAGGTEQRSQAGCVEEEEAGVLGAAHRGVAEGLKLGGF